MHGRKIQVREISYPLEMTNIAIEHGLFVVELPIKNDGSPMFVCMFTRGYPDW